MISDAGGFNDNSFNQSGWEGLKKAETELRITTKEATSKDGSDYASNLEAMQDENCDLTFTVGFLLKEATEAQATAFPNSNFAIIDDIQIKLDNVKPLVFKTSDAAYLAGYLAAAYTETGIVATFGGMQIPSVTIFMDGFVDGVARYNADNGTDVKVLGWDKETQNGSFTGDFDDQTKGANTTKNFIDQGADVIMPVAGPVGHGSIAAAKDSGKAVVIWVDSDGYNAVPENKDIFLTSVMKQIGQAVFDTIAEAKAGNFSATPYIGTLANGGVDIAPYHDFDAKVPQEVKDKIEQLRADIISGALVVDSPADPK
ncbi:MAG: BMP family ABC transporter substrate-binding protein [Propionibacteriaceae bacterium]|nr:BMP family ABC transporter substrate-binding protein [Propionibacteriaceae bacterium]